jgi:hypothetical protein
MPALKIRQGILTTNYLTSGSLGNAITKIQIGTGTVQSPSFAATAGASAQTATLTVGNAATSDKVWVTAASPSIAGLFISSAYVSAASVITMNFQASPCTAVAGCAMKVDYLLIAGS